MTTSYFFIFAEVFLNPLIVSFVIKRTEANKQEFIFLRKSEEYEQGKYTEATKSLLDRAAITKLVYAAKHKLDLTITLRRFFSYFFLTLSLYGLSTVIVPAEKYDVDKNFRDKISIFPGKTQLNVESAWNLIQEELLPLIHAGNSSNGEIPSRKDKAFARDSVNFRLGPSTLEQHRDQCGFFTKYWQFQPNATQRTMQKVLKSPLLASYFSETQSSLSSDIFLQAPNRLSSNSCKFTADLGTSKESAEYMINYLQENAWFDQETKLLIFEQSFLNMNINSFLKLRVVFEFVDGGAILPTLARLKY
ncbi:Oidioi.mRNA.OKI2018_I69.chr1.g1620.t1.cds [Oikopleura dioica]|uniref:Oidioi.mRNA.OKI2018_I69.chr1.g1620.t1.cds n=1 Tax=Oikopleura dioica TaxID=34765 RepID=A0ABN7STQ6_OIKDI|nr:Oidioi.mRNA.OKI2018_I69.chr1.g1620.t1.cds [Oikopleura dioica]